MGKNSELVTEIVGGEPYRYYPLGNYVVRAPDVCGGRPTFKYTRIEITGTLERLAAGEAIDTIVEGYRSRVPKEAIIEAINCEVRYNAAFSRFKRNGGLYPGGRGAGL